jgi:hypothetical protein
MVSNELKITQQQSQKKLAELVRVIAGWKQMRR